MISRRLIRALSAGVVLGIIPGIACSQGISINLGDGQSLSTQAFTIFVAMTVLSISPSLAIMVTCFPLIVSVLSMFRQGIGLQASPPNFLIIGLSLFLTWFVMEPTFLKSWNEGVEPFLSGGMGNDEAFVKITSPFRDFMSARINEGTFDSLVGISTADIEINDMHSAPFRVMVPAFMLSEMSRAFEIAFYILLPFLIVDLIVSAILMSMGMMMVPPAIVALPFKLAFLVVSDGFTKVAKALVEGYM
ncbi:flagellar biosynthetic protein FliP [Sinirhodobacter populi]|uniref:Flagellar biosynthetic protein FliP n=1 Tax=Paenirhodobacter populi TaxID=2306993 RepID=A0A443KAQ3_9RHOB|nr:flagellar type III secretion system pore protein FliP [Sinirhodobacter populi]RWR29911.1 flagellar biosynthetic protein FliP [Sinirhodobacter populi]